MSYDEESLKLFEEHKKKWESIVKKYEDADKKYHKENTNVLDGQAPSHYELEKCKKEFNIKLKKLKEKYNIGTQ